MPETRRKRAIVVGAFALILSPRATLAEVGGAIHAEGAAAHRVGSSDANQFGWGAGGLVAPEVRFNDAIGIELPLGAIGLSDSDAPPPTGQAEKGAGYALFALPGVRAYPLTLAGLEDGLWLAGGGGVARTGSDTLPAVDLRLGFDVEAGPAALGPFAGVVQMIHSESSLDSEDGRVALLGFHAVYDGAKNPAAVSSDRDRDGIVDERDTCPDQAEDMDGFADADGCLDEDNDGDAIRDADDACPEHAEDRDGFEDTDGCPESDNDDDGIADGRDACPNEAEDLDGRRDGDGCPEEDEDRDGVADAADHCPDEPETVNGYADVDGCPDREQVRVVGDLIVLDQRVHFRVDQADIMPSSWGLIEEVAGLLADHPEYELIHITGHADDTGPDDYNLRLSEARAESVVLMLVHHGIDRDRLSVQPRGESEPREAGAHEKARRHNRRVEFEILRRTTQLQGDAGPLRPTRAALLDKTSGARL
jgi:outer membrane protein OmpA-like peptidoglycan-associated protein